MSRRRTSQPAPNEREQRSSFTLSARHLVAWTAVGLGLAAGAVWLFLSEDSRDSDASARALDDWGGPMARPALAAPAGGAQRSEAPAAVRNVSWPSWDEQGNDEGDAGVVDAGAPQEFGAEVVVPVIPPPGEAPKRAQDTGLQFSSEGAPASQTPKVAKSDGRTREPAANVTAPALNPSASSAVPTATSSAAVHERTATEEPPPARPRAPDRGLVFSDSPAPLPNKH